MTDMTGAGGSQFFIWDRDRAEFVATDVASEEQMRRFGQSLYMSAGSGRGRVMTVFDPTGTPTSYAVSESTRRGELVPAGRAAGRAGVAETRQARRAAEGAAATRLVEGRAVARQREERQRELNRDYIDFDYQNDTGWLRISDDAKRMLLGDPTLLENQELSIRPEVIMDYVKYGNPNSPGLLMEGLSLYYINVDTPFGRRWINVEHATPEELAAAPRQVPLEVVNEEYRGSQTYEPLGEYNTSWEVLTNLGGDEASRRRWQSVVDFFTRAPSGDAGQVRPKNPFSNIADFPPDSFSTVTEITTVNGIPGIAQQRVVANPNVLIPWIANNYEGLTPGEKTQIDNLVVFARNNFVEDRVATLSPEEQRMAMRRGGVTNPWSRIVTVEAAAEGSTAEAAGNAAGIVTTAPPTPPRQQGTPSLRDVVAGRRFAGRYGPQSVERSRRRALYDEMTYNIINPMQQYEFRAVPLGFEAEEFDVNRGLRQTIENVQTQIGSATDATVQRGLIDARNQLLASGDETNIYTFREGTLPLTVAQRQYLTLADQYRNASDEEAVAGAARGLSMMRSSNPNVLESVRPLTPGEAQGLLRRTGPIQRARIKAQMALLGVADPNKYTTDTSLDKETRDKWEEIVTQANSEGKNPFDYLSQAVVANRNIVGRGTGSTRAVRELTLPAVDDVVAVVQDVARNRIGRRLDAQTASQVADAYLGVVESNFRAQAGATTFNEAMSAQTFGEQQITQQAGGEEMMYQTGLQLQELVKMIGGG